MAMPMESPITFSNVGKIRWWQRGIFASQTGYVLLALAVLLVVMHFASPYFFTEGNMQNVAKNFSFIAIATLGVTFVIITGGIDLSVGSMMCFSAMVTSMVMTELSAPGSPAGSLFVHMAADGKTVLANVPGLILVVSLLAGLGVALLAGLVNGFCIAVLGLSPFVTTLGMLSIVRGLGYVVSNGRGSFPGGPDADYFYALTSGDVLGVPVPFIYLIVLALAMAVVLHHSSFGRHVFALGGNEKAAELTGIPVVRVKIEVYVICALAAGLQGIIISGWLGSAPANMATSYELNVIAAAVIGGANLAGGIGGPLGAIVGCVLLEVIRNGLVLAQVSSYWQQTLVGVIIILAVLVDRIRSRMI
ncbi:ABC transporter permease [Bradyrhizobium sp. 44]|jgi:ribose transport system permease protein|uniref:ABC transporter permease n=1 Tax=unclassified Bradyrhizobium TaxID=2631580 RepID=UPI00048875D5|nr:MULTISPECIES: ABC transporter permease [unclassified Bradyrhizobium]MCK1378731.1 ABC transporter permease [Bradyrhizobium sp. 24]MCK1283099.1 ABC transporter permease [Bradyrhizobium sp. 44]MCK1299141.1 ABC transporter permease [Bradyrhizobium sp. 37]MCK1316571.1 ABC transporter permease [Bradyrhizobium sp. 23]MCK1329735.1 ABC transporter permease [Bradyrhizobium sp. CW9]